MGTAGLLMIACMALAQSKPFWTEKSSYSEGDRVYFVGVASKSKSREDGRERALLNSKAEAANFFQMSDVSFLTFETQMTFEEENKDGTFNVYRLMFINRDEVIKVKSKKLELAKKQEEIADDLAQAKSVADRYDERSKELKSKYQLLRKGMTEREVTAIMGQPRKRYTDFYGYLCLHYNEYTVVFDKDSRLYTPYSAFCK